MGQLALPYRLWQYNIMSKPDSSVKKRERLSPEERREQLLEAAITAYAQQGVERAGHADISKLTSASTATVFNYFPTREALTDAVLAYASGTLMDAISIDRKSNVSSSSEVLTELLRRFDELIERKPDLIKVVLNWSVSFGPSVRPQYLAYQDAVLSVLHSAVGKGETGEVGERAEARLIYAASISYATMKLDKSPDAVITEFVKRVIGIVE